MEVRQITVGPAISRKDAEDLDELLWRVLWQPLDLPRDFRRGLKVDGELLELLAREEARIAGGLVAVLVGETEAELRHMAVLPEARNRGVGRMLVERLVEIAGARGCRKIRTIARSTSVGFYRELGFRTVPGTAPEHPLFKKHGISFSLMDRTV